MPSALVKPTTKSEPETERPTDACFVAAPVQSGAVVQTQEGEIHKMVPHGYLLARSLLRVGIALALVAILVDQLVLPQSDTSPSLELRRVAIITITLAGWLFCSWRGFRHDFATGLSASTSVMSGALEVRGDFVVTLRVALPVIASALTAYVALIVVQLAWGPPVNSNVFLVALGPAFVCGFGYWYGERRKRQQR